jgi:hypothetical protein
VLEERKDFFHQPATSHLLQKHGVHNHHHSDEHEEKRQAPLQRLGFNMAGQIAPQLPAEDGSGDRPQSEVLNRLANKYVCAGTRHDRQRHGEDSGRRRHANRNLAPKHHWGVSQNRRRI